MQDIVSKLNHQFSAIEVDVHILSYLEKKPLKAFTALSTVILPNYLVWKFCGKVQFLQSFERIARNSAETVPFHKISTPGN